MKKEGVSEKMRISKKPLSTSNLEASDEVTNEINSIIRSSSGGLLLLTLVPRNSWNLDLVMTFLMLEYIVVIWL